MKRQRSLMERCLRHALPPGVRCAKWLDEVRQEPCCRCHAPGPSDPHHLLGSFGSLKTSDFVTVPLCRVCHEHCQRNHEDEEALFIGWMILVHHRVMECYLGSEGVKKFYN